jgi:hypothetical protein
MISLASCHGNGRKPRVRGAAGNLAVSSWRAIGGQVDSSPTIEAELTVPVPDLAHSDQIMVSGGQRQPLGMLEDDTGLGSENLAAMNLFQGLGIVLHGAVGRIDEDYIKLELPALQDSQ